MELIVFIFFFNDPATTEIYTLSLHDALPIYGGWLVRHNTHHLLMGFPEEGAKDHAMRAVDRKSTRLNSSHMSISYAVFCLKKKKQNPILPPSHIKDST